MNFRFTVLVSAAILLTGTALAGPKEDVLHDFARCTAIADDGARLACFDSLAPRAKEAIAPPAVAAVPAAPASSRPAEAPPPAPAPPPSPKEQEDWFGRNVGSLFDTAPEQQTTPQKFGADTLPEEKQEAESHSPKPIDSITAKLDDYAFTPMQKFIVFLNNGQVWRQLDGDDGHAHFHKKAKDNTVKISRGFMGTYDLVLNGEGLLFKVKRVK